MSRRRFVAGVVLAVTPLVATASAQEYKAQPGSSPVRIGFLPLGSPSNAYDQSLVEAFRQGLREAGLVENRQVVLDVVWVSGEVEAARAVGELTKRGAKLLVPCGSSASRAAKRHAPSTTSILFISVGDPVGIGLVKSLTRPGGNATGFSDVLADLSGKYVQFAREIGKSQATIHYLWHNGWADGQNRFQRTEQAAQSAGVKLRSVGIGDIAEVSDALATMKKAGADTVVIQPSPFTYRQREWLIASATSHGLATIFAFPPAAREGALIAVWPRLRRLVSPGCALRSTNSQRHEAGRPPRRRARELRAGRQPENCQPWGSRFHNRCWCAGHRNHPVIGRRWFIGDPQGR